MFVKKRAAFRASIAIGLACLLAVGASTPVSAEEDEVAAEFTGPLIDPADEGLDGSPPVESFPERTLMSWESMSMT